MGRTVDRLLFRAHRVLRHRQRELHYGAVPGFVRRGILVYRAHVAAAGALFWRFFPSREPHQTVSGGSLERAPREPAGAQLPTWHRYSRDRYVDPSGKLIDLKAALLSSAEEVEKAMAAR